MTEERFDFFTRMSKRKRASSETPEENRIEDEMLPGTSSESAEENRIEDEMLPGTSSESVEENKYEMSPETCKSTPSRFGFDSLSQLAMKHILQFLDLDDKINLRLTSRSLKKIIDHELIFCYSTRQVNSKTYDSWLWPDNDCISFKYDYWDLEDDELNDIDHTNTLVASTLCKISDRVTEISGPAEFLTNLEDEMSNFTNVKKVVIDSSNLSLKLLFPNLRILELCKVKIENVEGRETEFQLDQLEELYMHYFSCGNGVHALLSACRNIKTLGIYNNDDFDGSMTGISMPNLRSLELSQCGPNWLFLVRGSASTLTVLSLWVVDATISDIQIPNLSLLSVCCGWSQNQELKDLITNVASSVQELRLWNAKNFQAPISDFPKLEFFSFTDLPAIEAIKIIKHSPNLKYVKEKHSPNLKYVKFCNPVTKPSDQLPDTLYLGTEDFEVDEDKFLEAFNKPLRNLKELFLVQLNFEISELNNCELFKLTKIAMVECELSAGFENILNQCCSTLEELKLEDSSLEIDGEISELKSLKHISIICPYLDHHAETRSENTLNKLLKASSSSLEKLTLTLPPEPDMLSQIFDQVQLPNLKILHVYPRPTEEEINLILKHLPDDVTVWYFKPEKIIVHSVFYPEGRLELMKLVCPNVSFVNISD